MIKLDLKSRNGKCQNVLGLCLLTCTALFLQLFVELNKIQTRILFRFIHIYSFPLCQVLYDQIALKISPQTMNSCCLNVGIIIQPIDSRWYLQIFHVKSFVQPFSGTSICQSHLFLSDYLSFLHRLFRNDWTGFRIAAILLYID